MPQRLTIFTAPGDPEELLKFKHAVMDPVITAKGAEYGELVHVTARNPDGSGITIINLWETAEGSDRAAHDPDIQAVRAKLAAHIERSSPPTGMHYEVVDFIQRLGRLPLAQDSRTRGAPETTHPPAIPYETVDVPASAGRAHRFESTSVPRSRHRPGLRGRPGARSPDGLLAKPFDGMVGTAQKDASSASTPLPGNVVDLQADPLGIAE